MSAKEKSNVTAERLEWMRGKEVEVRIMYYEESVSRGEVFTGVYVDAVRLGEAAFLLVQIGHVLRAVNTKSIVDFRAASGSEE